MSVSDEESLISPPLFTPPPAPPLPPPPPFSRSAVTTEPNGLQRDISYSNFTADPVGDGQRAYKYAASVIPDNLESYSCVSFQRDVEPILQSGPQCGLVALAMADSVLNNGVTVEKLSEASKRKGFSKQGEIFSSRNLEILSAESYGCKTSLLDINNVAGKWEFLNCLARGDLLLVPYDPDKNYVPVLKKGHKAHWALVTGFFAAIKDENILSRFQRSKVSKDSTVSGLYHCECAPLSPNTHRLLPAEPMSTPRALSANIPMRSDQSSPSLRSVSARMLPQEPSENASKKLDMSQSASQKSQIPQNTPHKSEVPHMAWQETQTSQNASPKTEVRKNALIKASAYSQVPGSPNAVRNPLENASYILVYAKQGKSKHTGIWNAKTLVESCCNLIEIDPERRADPDSYSFPDTGIAEELCGKVVVLHMRK